MLSGPGVSSIFNVVVVVPVVLEARLLGVVVVVAHVDLLGLAVVDLVGIGVGVVGGVEVSAARPRRSWAAAVDVCKHLGLVRRSLWCQVWIAPLSLRGSMV